MSKWTPWLLAGLIACRGGGDEVAIRELNSDFAAAMNAGDVDVLMSLVTADIVMMPPGARPVRGAESVREMFVTMFDQVSLHETWTLEEVVVDGDLAYDWSSYVVEVTPHAEGDVSEEHGKNFFVSRRQRDGSWKYSRMIWSPDTR